jgi:FK506-binding nuclear protein
MAAIDPSEPAEENEGANGATRPRATLKIVRQPEGEDDDEYMRSLLAESDSEDEDEDDEEEANGGPSDPTKSKKARKEAALKQLMESLKAGDSDEEMEDGSDSNAAKKGKGKATNDDDEDDEEDSDDNEEVEVEEFVLCTLDPEQASHFYSELKVGFSNN